VELRLLTGPLSIHQIIEWIWSSGGIILTEENRSTRRKTCPNATLSPQIPYGLPWARTQATAVWRRRLTAWAMSRHHSTHALHVAVLVSLAVCIAAFHSLCNWASRCGEHHCGSVQQVPTLNIDMLSAISLSLFRRYPECRSLPLPSMKCLSLKIRILNSEMSVLTVCQ
jgi:hypothetical protein